MGRLFLALAALAAALAADAGQRRRLSDEFLLDGLTMRGQGDSAGELAHLRAAVRADRGNAAALLELARTEGALGRLSRAVELYDAALAAGGGEETRSAAEPEREALLRRGAVAPPAPGSRPQRHTTLRLPRVTRAELAAAPEELLAAPFVLVDAGVDARTLAGFSPRALAQDFGAQPVEIYPHNIRAPDSRPYTVSLDEGVELLQTGGGVFYDVDASGAFYLQWNLRWSTWTKLRDRLPLPAAFLAGSDGWLADCLPEELLDEATDDYRNMVTIGDAGAGMYVHQDTLHTASWQLQLAGAKRWHLCGPSENAYLQGRPDAFAPDYEAAPELLQATCYDDVVEANQFVYYPRDYWHQTRNHGEESVAISGVIVSPDNAAAVEAAMRAECEDGSSSARVCAAMEACWATWGGWLGWGEWLGPLGGVGESLGGVGGSADGEL